MATGPQQFGIQGQFNNAPIIQGANQVNAALAKTTQQVNQLNQQSRGLATTLGGAFNRPAQSLIFLGLDLQQLGRSLAVVGGTAIAAGAASTKFAIDFGDALADVNTLAQLSSDGLLRLGDRIRALSEDPQVLQGPTELTKALKFLLSSGFDTANAFAVLRTASVGATAGNADLATVTQALAGVLNALPKGAITANSALDIMFQTVKDGIIEFQDLAATQGEVLGALGATGVSFEEFGAAVSALTRAGIPANEAMTSLNRLLLSFIAPTAEAKKQAQELGIEFSLDSIRAKGLVESLKEIEAVVGGDTEALDKLFGDLRAVRGALSLTRNDVSDLTTLFASQQQATEGLGAANAALEEQLKAPSTAFKLLSRDLENAGITIGQDFLPLVIEGSKALRELVTDFSELPDSVKTAAFAIGATFAILGAGAFTVGTLATAIGALKNAYQTFSPVATGATGGLNLTTRAMQAQTIAATQLAAATALAGRAGGAGPLTLGQFRQLEQARASTQALQTATAGVTGFGNASRLAVGSFGQLMGLVGQVTLWGTLALAVGGALKVMSDFVAQAAIANSNLRQLSQTATSGGFLVNVPAKAAAARPELTSGAIPGLTDNQRLLQSQIADSAIDQARRANQEALNDAQARFPQAVANARQALAEAVNDPALQGRISAGLNRLLSEGPEALATSGFESLTRAQQAAVAQRLNLFEAAAQDAAAAGDTAAANFLRGLIEGIQEETGFNIALPFDLEAAFAPNISKARAEVLRLKEEMTNALKPFENDLKNLEKAQKATRIEQLQLNLAMQDAQRSFRMAQDAVKAIEAQIKGLENTIRELEEQFQDAQARVGNLGQPVEIGVKVVLQGLPELENQIFGIGQQIAQLQLELLNVNATFIPGMFEAEEAVLRAKLALIEMGDEAEEIGKKAQFGIDDLISAQQRELREGVPVLRTIFDKIRAAAEGKDGADKKSPEEEALEAAEKNLEILRIKQQLETIELRKKIEIANVEQQRLNLTKQLTFDPQIRELDLLANQLKEVTFEEAKAGIIAAREEMAGLRDRINESTGELVGLNEQLAGANSVLAERQAVVDALNVQQEDLQRRMTEFQIAEAGILERQAAIQESFNALIATANENLSNVEAAARRQATIPVNTPSDPSTWSSDVGNDYPIPFSTEQQQASNQMVAEAAAASAARSLQAADQAAGGIANLFLQLLATLGGAVSQSGGMGMPMFHEGGEVAPHLPAGTEVTARLRAGEQVLTGEQFSRLAHPVTPPPMMLPSGGSNWNWNVTINNQRGSDAYAKLYREAYMRRLGGRWR